MKPRIGVSVVMLVLFLLFGFATTAVMAEPAEQQATFVAPKLVVNTSFLNVRTGPGSQYTVLVTVVGGTELPVLGVARGGIWYQVATDAGPGWVDVSFTLPRGNFSNVPLVSFDPSTVVSSPVTATGTVVTVGGAVPKQGVALLGADLRDEPRDGALNLRSALPGDPNTIYPIQGSVTNEFGIWYLINYPGVGLGWINKAELRLLQCGNNNVGVLTRPETIRFDGIANRQGFLLEAGSEGFIRGFQGDFILFELVGEVLGLVPASSVAARPRNVVSLCQDLATVSPGQGGGGVAPEGQQVVVPALRTNRVIVNTGNLNIRSGPSNGFSSLAVVPGGTELGVVGRAPDGVWFLVQGSFGQGWLNSEFTIFRGNYGSVPVIRDISEAVQAAGAAVAALGQGGGSVASSGGVPTQGISLSGADLRDEPRDGALNLRSALPADPNTIYPIQNTVNNEFGTWYLINYPGVGLGWVNKAELRLLQCGNNNVGVLNRPEVIRFDGIANRDGFLLGAGSEGIIRGFQGDFILFELVGQVVGLVPAGSVDARPRNVVSLCQDIPAAGSVVTAPASGGTGQSGVVVPPAAPTGNRVIINTGNLNVRSGPSNGFASVATIAGGTQLAVVGRARDGVWLLVEGPFGRGWVNSEFTIFRGDYGSVPIVEF